MAHPRYGTLKILKGKQQIDTSACAVVGSEKSKVWCKAIIFISIPHLPPQWPLSPPQPNIQQKDLSLMDSISEMSESTHCHPH